jgi:hypothetical protein
MREEQTLWRECGQAYGSGDNVGHVLLWHMEARKKIYYFLYGFSGNLGIAYVYEVP